MMRMLLSIVLGFFATIVAVMAATGGWFLAILITDWITETGTAEAVIVGCATMVVFLLLTRFFYENVLIEESE